MTSSISISIQCRYIYHHQFWSSRYALSPTYVADVKCCHAHERARAWPTYGSFLHLGQWLLAAIVTDDLKTESLRAWAEFDYCRCFTLLSTYRVCEFSFNCDHNFSDHKCLMSADNPSVLSRSKQKSPSIRPRNKTKTSINRNQIGFFPSEYV